MSPIFSLKVELSAAFGLLALICAGQNALSTLKAADIRHSVTRVATNWLALIIANKEITGEASEVRIKQLRRVTQPYTASQLAEDEAQLALTHGKLAIGRSAYELLISPAVQCARYEALSATRTRAAASQLLGAASELSYQADTLAAEVGRFLATVRAA